MENPNVHKLFAITFIFIWFCFFTGCAPASHPSLMGSPTPEKLFFPSISPTVLPISPTLLPESPPVISLENANQLTPFLTWKSRINFVSWSPNGSYIGISTINNANEYGIYVLDVYRLQFIQYIGNANGTMAFSPYESLMVSDDGIINLWEVNTGELLRSYEGNAERYVVFNSATSILLVETYPFSSKTQIRLWNTKTGERTNTVELDGLARNISYDYSASILALPLQMENKSYIVVVWDVNQQKQVCSIPDNLYAEFIQTNDSLAVSNGKEISSGISEGIATKPKLG